MLEADKQPKYLNAWYRRDSDKLGTYCFNMGVMRCGVEVEASVRAEDLGRIAINLNTSA